MMDALFYCFLSYSLKIRVSYSLWNSLVSVSLVDRHVPEMYPPSSPLWGYRCAWPHMGDGDLNPGPHAVQQVLSATEPSPWPTAFISKINS